MQGPLLFAAVLTLAAGFAALGGPLLLQEALALQGGRAASVRLKPHACGPSCATDAHLATDVRLAQSAVWAEHALRLSELRVTTSTGEVLLLPVPPTRLIEPGERFRIDSTDGRLCLQNCSRGVEMLLPRRLLRDTSPVSGAATLPLLLVLPWPLLAIFVGSFALGTVDRVDAVATATGADTGDLDATRGQAEGVVGQGLAWLLLFTLLACAAVAYTGSARWPRPRRVLPDGALAPL